VLLRLCLTGRLVTPGPLGPRAPSWKTMALMFAADRLDHVEAEIAPLLEDGVTVISDRYYHSSVAYQALSAEAAVNEPAVLTEPIAWIRTLNAYARRPDLTIVLDVPLAEAAARRRMRGGRELYDDDELQARLVDFYARLEQHFPGEPIVHVPGVGSVEQVASAILSQVDARR
jgi:dTMP kinase